MTKYELIDLTEESFVERVGTSISIDMGYYAEAIPVRTPIIEIGYEELTDLLFKRDPMLKGILGSEGESRRRISRHLQDHQNTCSYSLGRSLDYLVPKDCGLLISTLTDEQWEEARSVYMGSSGNGSQDIRRTRIIETPQSLLKNLEAMQKIHVWKGQEMAQFYGLFDELLEEGIKQAYSEGVMDKVRAYFNPELKVLRDEGDIRKLMTKRRVRKNGRVWKRPENDDYVHALLISRYNRPSNSRRVNKSRKIKIRKK